MDQVKKTKAMIVIGETCDVYYPDYEVYYFPDYVTEWELAEEILNLVPYYDELVYPIYWPPHIRKEKVIAWIQNAQPQCQESTQCNMFCKNYEKGCTLNATE